MPSQQKLIKQGIKYTDAVFEEIAKRLEQGVKSTDTLEDFLVKYKEYTQGEGKMNPLVLNGYDVKMLEIILQETNNHKFSRPAQKELVRITIENKVGELIRNVGDDIVENVRDIVKYGYNNGLSQDKIAKKISSKVTSIKNKRARTIARTEIARTATISDYVISSERGATHFYVECRNTACPICKEAWHKNWTPETDDTFEPSDKSAGGKGWIGDKEYSMNQTDKLPPIHPNCRCVAYFFKKEGVKNEIDFNKEPLSSNSEGVLRNIFSPLKTHKDYSESKLKFSPISVTWFKKQIKGFVDSADNDIIANIVSTFRNDVPNVNVEFGATYLYKSIIGFSSFSNFTKIPLWIRKIGSKKELLVVIHNHGYDLSNFPSHHDLESYTAYGVKYGITTTNFGTMIVKNPDNVRELNKQRVDDIKEDILNIRKDMIRDFEKKFNKEFDENNIQHNKEISKMIDDDKEKYLEQYRTVLNKYDMSITFINEQI